MHSLFNLIVGVLGTIACIFYETSAWAGGDAKVVEIETSRGHCSLTIIKHKGACRAVTNAHCLNNNDKKITLQSRATHPLPMYRTDAPPETVGFLPEVIDFRDENETARYKDIYRYESRFFHNDFSKPQSTLNVLRIDRSMDLAEVAVAPELCSKGTEVKELSPLPVDLSCGHAVVGYAKDQKSETVERRVFYNQDTKFRLTNLPHYKPAKVTQERSVYKNVESFLVLNETNVLPGNSGGAVFNCGESFAGITSRQHRTQDKVYVISKSDVMSFLDSERVDHQEVAGLDPSTFYVGGGNGGTGTNGGNGGTGTNGGNGGTGTNGGNGGTGTNGGNGGTGTNGEEACYPNELLHFLEPLEGIIDETGKSLLSIEGHQIDGMDNFFEHRNLDGEKIYRDANGYPSEEVRAGILSRLAGSHSFENSRQKIYVRDENHVFGHRDVAAADSQASINLESEILNIQLGQAKNWAPVSKLNSVVMAPELSSAHGAKSFNFRITKSPDHKTVTLQSADRTLNCDNRNYLKLICKGEDMQFSISKDQSKNGKADFRLTLKNGEQTNYYFGAENE